MKLKHYIFILLAIIASPIVVDVILYTNNPISNLLPTVGDPNEWIGFWGNVVGNILGGIIVLIVLHYTLKENAASRETQVKTIKYTQQQAWLDNLRQQVIGNYNMLDMQGLSTALYKLQQEEYEEAQKLLLSLNRNIEFQANSSSLYFLHDDLSREEQEYIDCMKRIMIEYGGLVNDSIFFLAILPDLTKKTEQNVYVVSHQAIISLARSSYNAIILSDIFDDETKKYYSKNSVLPKVMVLDPRDDDFFSKLKTLFSELFQKISSVHVRKHDLIRCTENVLRYEDRRIQQILE